MQSVMLITEIYPSDHRITKGGFNSFVNFLIAGSKLSCLIFIFSVFYIYRSRIKYLRSIEVISVPDVTNYKISVMITF